MIEIGDDQDNAVSSGGTSGLRKAFAGGSGTGASNGRVVAGSLVPSGYVATTVSAKKAETIRMTLTSGYVKEFSIEPEPPVDPERLAITDAHRRNVLDPMTGSLIRAAGSGEVLTADSCRTGMSIFDGRMRYDLKLDYKRMETVKAEKGLSRPRFGLRALFHAGGRLHSRPRRDQISRRAAQHGSLVRADRRNKGAGAVQGHGADSARQRDAGGGRIRHHRHAADRGEDELTRARALPRSCRKKFRRTGQTRTDFQVLRRDCGGDIGRHRA